MRWIGAVALFGIAAYLVTPLSAAGAEGAPEAFGINIRFVIPALLVGPRPAAAGARPRRSAPPVGAAGRPARRPRPHRPLRRSAARPGAGLRGPRRGACGRSSRRRCCWRAGAEPARGAARRGGFAALVAGAVAIGYPVQRDYLRRPLRRTSIPSMNLDTAYRWASGTEDARIGLAGTHRRLARLRLLRHRPLQPGRYLGEEGPQGRLQRDPDLRRLPRRGQRRRPRLPGHRALPQLHPSRASRSARRRPAGCAASRRVQPRQSRRPGHGLEGPTAASTRAAARSSAASACRSARCPTTPQGLTGRQLAYSRRVSLPARERALPVGGGLARARGAARRIPPPTAAPTGSSTRSATSCGAASARPSAPPSWPSSTPSGTDWCLEVALGGRAERRAGPAARSPTPPSGSTCAAPATSPAAGSWPSTSRASALVVSASAPLAGAADDDLVGLDPHRDLAVAGPVLGVDRVVLDRGVEPEAEAVLLAVVEGRLQLAAARRARRAGRGAGGGAAGPRPRFRPARAPRAVLAAVRLLRLPPRRPRPWRPRSRPRSRRGGRPR